MSREWRLYVADMKACCGRVAEYTSGLSREEFERKRLVYDATLRNLELLGEAARHVPEEARTRAPDIRWRRIVGERLWAAPLSAHEKPLVPFPDETRDVYHGNIRQ